MLSRETLDGYRHMTNAERWLLTARLIRENTPALLAGPAEVVERRFELLRRQNDDRNRLIRECLGRMEQSMRETANAPLKSSGSSVLTMTKDETP